MDCVLRMENLSYQYDKNAPFILKDINFCLNKGEFVLLTGPSGQGKSTFINICNGVIPHIYPGQFSGKLYIHEQPIQTEKDLNKSNAVGSVLQNADEQIIFERVEDEIAFPCENMGLTEAEIENRIKIAAQEMELDLRDYTTRLSGGQKQRLITATTLAMQKRILLLDEPLANLDLISGKKLLKKLKAYCENEGYSVIFIEHRLDFVLPYCNRICWIEAGKLENFTSKDAFNGFWVKKNQHVILAEKKAEEHVDSSPKIIIKNNQFERVMLEEASEQSNAKMLLQLKDVSYKKKDVQILRDINFSLKEGERWIVVGDNGAGKSTFLRLLAGLIKPTQGSVQQQLVQKKSAVASSAWYKKLGFVMQNPNYQLYMSSVQQEIEVQAQEKSQVEDLLKAFSLQDFKERHPHSLSEGQKRRLGIAAILSMKPELIFLDEPTVGLDYKTLLDLLNILFASSLASAKTSITISHDLRCLKILGSKVLWLKDGTIYKQGTLEIIDEFIQYMG